MRRCPGSAMAPPPLSVTLTSTGPGLPHHEVRRSFHLVADVARARRPCEGHRQSQSRDMHLCQAVRPEAVENPLQDGSCRRITSVRFPQAGSAAGHARSCPANGSRAASGAVEKSHSAPPAIPACPPRPVEPGKVPGLPPAQSRRRRSSRARGIPRQRSPSSQAAPAQRFSTRPQRRAGMRST